MQMHHQFASKLLVDSLKTHGFCSSSDEVKRFVRGVAISKGTDIPGTGPGSCLNIIQYVADNVDHNTFTPNGSNTFHVLGMIATVTPGTKTSIPVKKTNVKAEDLLQLGRIKLLHYKSASSSLAILLYKTIVEMAEVDPTANTDLLWKTSWLLRHHVRLSWSGVMQTVDRGQFPGQSSVAFLPMNDMDPNNIFCIFFHLDVRLQRSKKNTQ